MGQSGESSSMSGHMDFTFRTALLDFDEYVHFMLMQMVWIWAWQDFWHSAQWRIIYCEWKTWLIVKSLSKVEFVFTGMCDDFASSVFKIEWLDL